MTSSGMLGLVVLVRTKFSEERIASLKTVTIGELGTTLAVTELLSYLPTYSTESAECLLGTT
jgi:hypothetical protein